MLSSPRSPSRTIRICSSAENRRRVLRRMSQTTRSADFAWLRGTSSPGCKVSPISAPHVVHIYLTPNTREERARLREERKVAAELAEEKERLGKERTHLVQALEALRATGSSDPDLERKLADIDEAIAQNDYRAANIRAGYVYVISNRGAFGEHVVKIGLTRRLEPLDRVHELGGASVPFRFDVHGLFFSEDAVTLESELHEHFAAQRVNHANVRKELFFASPSEVRTVLASKIGNLLEFNDHAESTEYLQSVRYWLARNRPDLPGDSARAPA